ncbi:MAG TPA: caspase family protein [Verrucomicrobiales bacterium]|nr:caspase family protein [Verrucomicrobiales bacterium]
MSTPIKILFIHGIGFQEEDPRWQPQWKAAAEAGIKASSPDAAIEARFFNYDAMFKENDAPNVAMVTQVGSMLGSWVTGKVGGLFGRNRGFFGDVVHDWNARPGMVAEWAGDTKLRAALRKSLQAEVLSWKPDVIAAHSLGTLLSYDWLRSGDAPANAIESLTYLTFGCQISNPALTPIFGGQILKPAVKQWINLWNRQDKVFVSSVRINEDGFRQVELNESFGHDGTGYLQNATTSVTAWNQIALTYAEPAVVSRAMLRGAVALSETKTRKATVSNLLKARMQARESRKRKALLIGINNYANPQNNLEGCVNDVFEMSAVLQECGFDPDDIRVVLDERATAQGIKERIEWLLDGARGDDERFLYYSGHGAQIPSYGADDIPEEVDECLVPHDFAWTPETAVVDDWFYEIYHNLPYTVQFVTMMDCCHSGGMARDGGARVRGLTPPDDIRHRALRWDRKAEMWVPREQFATTDKQGSAGVVSDISLRASKSLGSGKIGRSKVRVHRSSAARETKGVDPLNPYGPFQPLLLKACGKDELAMEYRHGTHSYGAFTYCITRLLRHQKKSVSFKELIGQVKEQLHTLGYTQHPDIEGPDVRQDRPVPWKPESTAKTSAAKARPRGRK